MDPAVAAAMSDPERNPLFRRRWVEAGSSASELPASYREDDSIELTGLALLMEWRRQRDVVP